MSTEWSERQGGFRTGIISVLAGLMLVSGTPAFSAGEATDTVPSGFGYAGRLRRDGALFTGQAVWRLAIVDAVGRVLWTNDGSGQIPPVAGVVREVAGGVVNLAVGQPQVAGEAMQPVPSAVFATPRTYLRAWVAAPTTAQPEELIANEQPVPHAQAFQSVPYSHRAAEAARAESAGRADVASGLVPLAVGQPVEVQGDLRVHGRVLDDSARVGATSSPPTDSSGKQGKVTFDAVTTNDLVVTGSASLPGAVITSTVTQVQTLVVQTSATFAGPVAMQGSLELQGSAQFLAGLKVGTGTVIIGPSAVPPVPDNEIRFTGGDGTIRTQSAQSLTLDGGNSGSVFLNANSTGRVSIGGLTPQARLDIFQPDDTNATAALRVGAGANSTKFRVDGAGNIDATGAITAPAVQTSTLVVTSSATVRSLRVQDELLVGHAESGTVPFPFAPFRTQARFKRMDTPVLDGQLLLLMGETTTMSWVEQLDARQVEVGKPLRPVDLRVTGRLATAETAVFGSSASVQGTLVTTGPVGVGTLTPGAMLDIQQPSTSGQVMRVRTGIGTAASDKLSIDGRGFVTLGPDTMKMRIGTFDGSPDDFQIFVNRGFGFEDPRDILSAPALELGLNSDEFRIQFEDPTGETTGKFTVRPNEVLIATHCGAASITVGGSPAQTSAPLEVSQIVTTPSSRMFAVRAGPDSLSVTDKFVIDGDGTTVVAGELTAHGTIHAAHGDVAERFLSAELISLGEVVRPSPTGDGKVVRASIARDPGFIGVASASPGLVLASKVDGVPIALSGRVKAWCSAENGAITPGTPLTTASTPGHLMKADAKTPPGAIVGVALGRLDSGAGLIEIVLR